MVKTHDICKNCGHSSGWHLHLAKGSPYKSPCNSPKCICNEFVLDKEHSKNE